MKKLLLLTLGRLRILWDCCPWCNSSAPGIDLCPICDGIGRDLRELPPSKKLKKKWWIRFKYRVRMETTKPDPQENKPPSEPYFSSTSSFPFMEQLMREYVIPGLKDYQIRHGFYPPTEARFLKKILHKPQVISDEDWATVLKRVGEEIEKLEREKS